jgi:hypothetical protein
MNRYPTPGIGECVFCLAPSLKALLYFANEPETSKFARSNSKVILLFLEFLFLMVVKLSSLRAFATNSNFLSLFFFALSVKSANALNTEDLPELFVPVKTVIGANSNSVYGSMVPGELFLPAYLTDLTGVYLIEEPENAIHPKAVDTVFQSLTSVYGAQVLLATHSPVILSMVEADKVLCFAKTPEGETDIVRGIDHPNLKEWEGEVNLVIYLPGVSRDDEGKISGRPGSFII